MAADETEGWYLFGVLPPDGDVDISTCPPFAGHGDVRLVRAANLFAVAAPVRVSTVISAVEGEDPERLTGLVREHDRVLRRLAGNGRALVPLRFATVADDLADLRRRVEAHCPALYEALARLEGCDELGVHVTVPRDAPQRAVRTMAREVYERLARCSEDAVIEPTAASAREERPSVLSAAFLVNRDRRAAFDAAVDGLRAYWDLVGGSITVSGPWPCYHFARVDLGAAGCEEALVLLGPLSEPEHAWSP
jgi:hypothetical protein